MRSNLEKLIKINDLLMSMLSMVDSDSLSKMVSYPHSNQKIDEQLEYEVPFLSTHLIFSLTEQKENAKGSLCSCVSQQH